jgi:hypothetical protein
MSSLGPIRGVIPQHDVRQPLTFKMVAADGYTPVTGLTPTVRLYKNGAAEVVPAGSVVERSGGIYALLPAPADVGTPGELILHATGAAARNTDDVWVIEPSGDADFSPLPASDDTGSTSFVG